MLIVRAKGFDHGSPIEPPMRIVAWQLWEERFEKFH
jgi:hypothetical protein